METDSEYIKKHKTTLMADACYLAKRGSDLHDVEVFLEASEQIIRNNINGTESDISLVSLKRIQEELYLVRQHVKESISISLKPNIFTKIYHDNLCPICGSKPSTTCRCPRLDSTCDNGHSWHTCAIHKIKVNGFSDHSIDTFTCTCAEKEK